ncbi:hypothetical protein [Vibrio splendidus]|uniref:ATPase n=1 Tax=Vibrio splendidus 12E03 TaxID=1191305 RepID=A0A1E5FB99_VIBSP|nr:hypothetical protein [Vibrio splendidus]OEF85187.1 hypothetical protein A142_12875 [Vibrio splendidus 12E03]
MKNIKILFAYCHELERSISINEARFEFFSQKIEERKPFKFSCSDRQCGVLMSGVNYRVMPEDDVTFKAAHYRSPHPHMPNCEWNQFAEDMEQECSNETDEVRNERQVRAKLKDHINHFTPWAENDDGTNVSHGGTVSSDYRLKSDVSHKQGNKKDNSKWQQYTKTNQLQRLTDTWQDAKNKLSSDERRALRLHVPPYGKVYLYRYITHIKNGLSNQYEGVVYGGGLLKKRYGRGFLFQFFDKYNNQAIHLYVSKEVMNNGRFGHYIDEVLNTDNVKYFQVFLLNPAISERENAQGNTIINLNITDLRQLVIYYELKTKTSAESKSKDNCGEI